MLVQISCREGLIIKAKTKNKPKAHHQMNEKTSCDVFVQRNDSQQGEKQAPLNTNARIKLK